ncbi:response regulator transcription factor [Paenibacillus hexagrammi]|uniref:Response regulator n=1 Tax=Paenibacillus hexagrammi TaxID=2908839 RepID=A0ABY3SNS4_9BACL|nr:response regulator [Paenibacillus sp. YPD9-1]UJF34866.1 response regulator [Paenibacillus sp. YPD9-1]
MIKAIVVDDERLVRKGFISLVDWSSYGIVIVGEAADGKSALSLLRETEVDLLFADITMPGLSGFELIKQVRQSFPHIHSVVLTCHHEFDFIQEAIRLGAIDYIVKTLLEVECIDKVMTRIVERIEWEEGNKKAYHAMKLEKRFPTDKSLVFLPLTEHSSANDLQRLPLVQKHALIEINGVWVMPLLHANREEDWKLGLQGLGEAGWLAIVLTDVQDRFLEETAHIVQERASHLIFYGQNDSGWIQIDFHEIEQWKSIESSKDLEVMFRDLKWLLYTAEWELLVRKVEELNPSPALIEKLTRELCELWRGVLVSQGIAESLQSAINMNTTWTHWKVWLNRFADGAKGRMLDLGLSKEVMYCLIRAFIYMRLHAGEKINQKDVAVQINMSRSYFSQCFAKLAGANFGDVLRGMRIERAKALLLESDWPIYEVASRAGFEDEKYFSRLFREFVGRSPSEFRASHA